MSTCKRNKYIFSNNKAVFHRFWMRERELKIEQTQFLSSVFLCSECKSGKICSICGNLFLQIAGKTAKITKIKTPKTLEPNSRFSLCPGLRFFPLSHACDKLITPFLKPCHVVETQHYLFIFFINRFAQDCKDTVHNAHEDFSQERTNMMLQD